MVPISAKTGQGIASVKAQLFNGIVTAEEMMHREQAMPNLRQRRILERAQKAVRASIEALQQGGFADIVSAQLHAVIRQLQDVSGVRSEGDLYDHIFDQFCIGK